MFNCIIVAHAFKLVHPALKMYFGTDHHRSSLLFFVILTNPKWRRGDVAVVQTQCTTTAGTDNSDIPTQTPKNHTQQNTTQTHKRKLHTRTSPPPSKPIPYFMHRIRVWVRVMIRIRISIRVKF